MLYFLSRSLVAASQALPLFLALRKAVRETMENSTPDSPLALGKDDSWAKSAEKLQHATFSVNESVQYRLYSCKERCAARFGSRIGDDAGIRRVYYLKILR